MIREQFFEVQGKSINCGVGPGNGPPLIMLHGVTRRWQTYVPLLPALTARFEVFAFDYLGHGQSDRSTRGYRVADYVETLTSLLSLPPFSNQKQVFLYGHSLGAMVAAALAGRFSQRVKGLILEDPPFDTMGQRIATTPLLSYFEGLKDFAGTTDPVGVTVQKLAELRITCPVTQGQTRLGDIRDAASLRFAAKSLSQLDPRVFDAILTGQWLDGYDTEQILAAVRCPTLLLQADIATGGMLSDDDARQAEALLTDVTHIRLPGVGHLIHWLRTEELLRSVQGFLESV